MTNSTAPYDSRIVANYLLDLASDRKLTLTQLVLYKILYFAHGWYLSSFDKPLLTQEFEAWQLGPVVKVLRDQFEKFGKRPITERAEKLNIYTGEYEPVDGLLDVYVKGVALVIKAGIPATKPDLRGYRIIDPREPRFL
jgi:uncharacterized phage-associated protein